MFSPECNAISFLGVSDRTNLKHCYSTYIVCSLTSSQDYTNLLYFSLAHLYLSLLPFFFLQLPTEPNNPFYPLSMPLISCKHMSVCTCAFWAETGFRVNVSLRYCEICVYFHSLRTTFKLIFGACLCKRLQLQCWLLWMVAKRLLCSMLSVFLAWCVWLWTHARCF